jgi:hypothetical protein
MNLELKAATQPTNEYETDFYAWTQAQAKLLQTGDWNQLDITNLVEEIESLGKQVRQELRNRLGVLLGHLLKWEFQPTHRSRSWLITIREQRRRIVQLINGNPSLQPYCSEAIALAYEDAIDLVLKETLLGEAVLPEVCPYGWEQILDRAFLPGESSET